MKPAAAPHAFVNKKFHWLTQWCWRVAAPVGWRTQSDTRSRRRLRCRWLQRIYVASTRVYCRVVARLNTAISTVNLSNLMTFAFINASVFIYASVSRVFVDNQDCNDRITFFVSVLELFELSALLNFRLYNAWYNSEMIGLNESYGAHNSINFTWEECCRSKR